MTYMNYQISKKINLSSRFFKIVFYKAYNPKILIFIILHSVYIFTQIIKIIFKQTNSSSFYILNIGGFGHTITQAETYYEYLDNSGKVICIYTPKRHNPKIDILYPDRYYLINRSKFFWLIDPKHERALYEFSERVIIKFLTYLFNRFRRRTYIYNWDSIIKLVSPVKLRIYGQGILELFFRLFSNSETLDSKPWNKEINIVGENLILQLKRKFDGKKYCCFYFRAKGVAGEDKADNHSRNTRNFTELLDIFAYLKSIGFLILLYGDIPDNGLDEARLHGVLTYEDMSISKDIWDLLAPSIGEFTIGSPGGGLMLPVKFRKKILVIDAFGYHFAVPNALHAYKYIVDENLSLVSPLTYIAKTPWIYDFPESFTIRYLPVPLLIEILKEFLGYINHWPDSNITYFEIHEHSWLTISPGALVSEKFLEYINNYDKI
jgi:hypothetical protein